MLRVGALGGVYGVDWEPYLGRLERHGIVVTLELDHGLQVCEAAYLQVEAELAKAEKGS